MAIGLIAAENRENLNNNKHRLRAGAAYAIQKDLIGATIAVFYQQ
jgi:hypothetical protein